jgi:hypothetical protein
VDLAISQAINLGNSKGTGNVGPYCEPIPICTFVFLRAQKDYVYVEIITDQDAHCTLLARLSICIAGFDSTVIRNRFPSESEMCQPKIFRPLRHITTRYSATGF